MQPLLALCNRYWPIAQPQGQPQTQALPLQGVTLEQLFDEQDDEADFIDNGPDLFEVERQRREAVAQEQQAREAARRSAPTPPAAPPKASQASRKGWTVGDQEAHGDDDATARRFAGLELD